MWGLVFNAPRASQVRCTMCAPSDVSMPPMEAIKPIVTSSATIGAELVSIALREDSIAGKSLQFKRLEEDFVTKMSACTTQSERDELRRSWTKRGGVSTIIALAFNPITVAVATGSQATAETPRRRPEEIRAALSARVAAAEAEERKALDAAAAAQEEASAYRAYVRAHKSEVLFLQWALERAESGRPAPGTSARNEPATPADEATPQPPRAPRKLFGRLFGRLARKSRGKPAELPAPACASRLAPRLKSALPEIATGSDEPRVNLRLVAAARRTEAMAAMQAVAQAERGAKQLEAVAHKMEALAARARAVADARRTELATQQAVWAFKDADPKAISEAAAIMGAVEDAVLGSRMRNVVDWLEGVAAGLKEREDAVADAESAAEDGEAQQSGVATTAQQQA